MIGTGGVQRADCLSWAGGSPSKEFGTASRNRDQKLQGARLRGRPLIAGKGKVCVPNNTTAVHTAGHRGRQLGCGHSRLLLTTGGKSSLRQSEVRWNEDEVENIGHRPEHPACRETHYVTVALHHGIRPRCN